MLLSMKPNESNTYASAILTQFNTV